MVMIIPSKLVIFFVMVMDDSSFLIQCIKKILNFVNIIRLNTWNNPDNPMVFNEIFHTAINTAHKPIVTDYTFFTANYNFPLQKYTTIYDICQD